MNDMYSRHSFVTAILFFVGFVTINYVFYMFTCLYDIDIDIDFCGFNFEILYFRRLRARCAISVLYGLKIVFSFF